MKKIIISLLTIVMCVSCVAGGMLSFAAETEAETALPDYYKTSVDDYTAILCKGESVTEGDVKYIHFTGDEGTEDAYFFPENGWGPKTDHPVMLLKYRTPGGAGQLFYTTAALAPGDEGTFKDVEFPASETEWQYLVYDFRENGFACFESDADKVNFFRVDLNAIPWMDYAFVAFFATADEANAFAEAEKAGKVKLIADEALVTTKYTVSPRSADPMQFNGHSVAIEFTVPEGKSFKSFILTAAPTWGVQENSTLEAWIYAWNKDYDTTIEGTELGTFLEEEHSDNANLTMDFGVILPPGKYVIVMLAENDTIGAWGGNIGEVNFEAVFYLDDFENDTWFPYSEILLADGTEKAIVLPTPGPTAEPTEKPTEAPTAEATEKPTEAPATEAAATDAPAKTGDAGSDQPSANPTDAGKDNGSANGGLPAGAIIGIVAAVVVVAAVIAGVVIAKSKKK